IMGEGWTPTPVGGLITDPVASSIVGDDVSAEWRERMLTWRRFGDWLEAVEEQGVSPNVGSYLGGGTIRSYAKGMAMGPAGRDELDVMRRVTHEAMEDGAFGVSYALIYPPDAYTDTAELVEVSKVAARHGGTYITHMRSESVGIFEALDEAMTVGREAGLPVEIYHLKAAGPESWWRMPGVIDRIERARTAGLDITADMYPYAGSGTGLTAILPTWTAADGALYDNLATAAVRTRVREELEAGQRTGAKQGMGLEANGGPHGIMPLGFRLPEHQHYVGMRLDEIAESRGQDWIEAVLDLLLAEKQRIGTIYFSMDEANLRLQVPLPWVKFSSDAGGFDPAWAKAEGPVHPRAYGTFPRVLRRYVREERLITLEDAVRKMTSAVADRLGIPDRGLLRQGMKADVVLFDAAAVTDHATFDEPHQLSTGVSHVWVNGELVIAGGTHTGALPGRFVKGPGAR
ncbi:MAG TPA: amidohydrolase family protein, partial [Trueperaceae bacterium]|nr:amidohydrolase family protein [Trueperaceae bacterium]